MPGPVAEAVAAAAHRHGIVVVLGVNERDRGSPYNASLVLDANGTQIPHRRKITATFHERTIWGQGDGAGLKLVDTAVGRVGALTCWEHCNPLARFVGRGVAAAAVRAVTRLSRHAGGGFRLETTADIVTTDTVTVAAGGYHAPTSRGGRSDRRPIS